MSTVFIIDDDPGMRESLRRLMESVALQVACFDSARNFLEKYEPGTSGCLVLDVRLPDQSGLELQEGLRSRGISLPVIMITGHADAAIAVRAMRQGAMDFLEKPFSDQVLLDQVQQAIKSHEQLLEAESQQAEIRKRIEQLTPREQDVVNRVVGGKSTKEIAADLGLSPRTVEVHRSRVMDKMRAGSVAELVRMKLTADCGMPSLEGDGRAIIRGLTQVGQSR